MTTPSKVSGSASNGAQTGASITVTPGVTVTPGNVMLVAIGQPGASGAFGLPTGWSTFFNSVVNSRSQCVAYKVAGGSEPSSYTFTSANSGQTTCWCYLEYQTVNTSTLPDGTAAVTSGSSTTVSWGSTSPANTNDLWVLATVAYFSTASTWVPATGFATEASEALGSGTNSCLIDDKGITASGATGTASSVQSHLATYQAVSFCLAGTSSGTNVALPAAPCTAAIGGFTPGASAPLAAATASAAIGGFTPQIQKTLASAVATGAIGGITPSLNVGLSPATGIGTAAALTPSGNISLTLPSASGTGSAGTFTPSDSFTLLPATSTGQVATFGPQESRTLASATGTGVAAGFVASLSVSLSVAAGTGVAAGFNLPGLLPAASGIGAAVGFTPAERIGLSPATASAVAATWTGAITVSLMPAIGIGVAAPFFFVPGTLPFDPEFAMLSRPRAYGLFSRPRTYTSVSSPRTFSLLSR